MCQACGCPSAGNEQIEIQVKGITDKVHVEEVQKTLMRLPGIQHVHVHLHDGMTTVDYNPRKISIADIERALGAVNYIVP